MKRSKEIKIGGLVFSVPHEERGDVIGEPEQVGSHALRWRWTTGSDVVLGVTGIDSSITTPHAVVIQVECDVGIKIHRYRLCSTRLGTIEHVDKSTKGKRKDEVIVTMWVSDEQDQPIKRADYKSVRVEALLNIY